MEYMKKNILLIIGAVALACSNNVSGQTKKRSSAETDDPGRNFAKVVLDPGATWMQVCEAADIFADILIADMQDTSSTYSRVHSQEIGYIVIASLTEKYMELMDAGKEVSEKDLSRIVENVDTSIHRWFHNDDNKNRPNLWKDLYYLSNKSAENPVNGYFHLIVDIPTEEHPAPSLYIFFPQSAEKDPYLVFRENPEEPIYDENLRKEDFVLLPDWHRKNENNDGFPMFAGAGPEVIDRMLHNAVMYVVFHSEETPEGEAGEMEVAHIPLEGFQKSWQTYVH